MTTETPLSPPPSHEPRLSQALRALLHSTRVAALGTLHGDGTPFVSMVPFALWQRAGTPAAVIHVSGLAPHARNLEGTPLVSLMVMQPEVAGEPVHALPRVSFVGQASNPKRHSPDWEQALNVYLERFPEAEPMTELGDFRCVVIDLQSARQVAGFGAARALDAEAIAEILCGR